MNNWQITFLTAAFVLLIGILALNWAVHPLTNSESDKCNEWGYQGYTTQYYGYRTWMSYCYNLSSDGNLTKMLYTDLQLIHGETK